MHSDDPSWKFPNWEPGLSKCLIVFQYLSSINKLHVIYGLRSIFFIYQIDRFCEDIGKSKYKLQDYLTAEYFKELQEIYPTSKELNSSF